METKPAPEITSAEIVGKGVVIHFGNGKCGFYSAQLLFDAFQQAQALDENEVVW